MYVADSDDSGDTYSCTRLRDLESMGKLAYWAVRIGKWLAENPIE